MSALIDSLLLGFDALPARDAAGLGATRRAAHDAARDAGLPGARTERWKYTSLRALERRRFARATSLPTLDANELDLPEGPRLVFVNGLFAPALSALDALPDGITLAPLSATLAQAEPADVAHLAQAFERNDEPFARANAAMAVEGMLLRVRAGTRVEQALHLVLVGAADADAAWHLRHRIELGEAASLALVEHHRAAGEHAHLANDVMQISLARGARLVHARCQAQADAATSFLRTQARLQAEAEYRRVDLELGAGMSRHELDVRLEGEGASLHAHGVLLASGRRHLDTRLGIDHAARDTRCELVWRGLGAGRGRAVFHGGILIREGADGSEAMLSNKNLLLSEGAEIDTQPVLEIHADEVKAAHGATVGRLDPAALFYLRTRGLPEAQARELLTAAFCREVLGLLGDDAIAATLAARLDAALARTNLFG
jgi:Fe-S cluster assembly protein SufD